MFRHGFLFTDFIHNTLFSHSFQAKVLPQSDHYFSHCFFFKVLLVFQLYSLQNFLNDVGFSASVPCVSQLLSLFQFVICALRVLGKASLIFCASTETFPCGNSVTPAGKLSQLSCFISIHTYYLKQVLRGDISDTEFIVDPNTYISLQ